MYKIMHLPTGTYVKCFSEDVRKSYRKRLTDWYFIDKTSAENVCRWELVVDYDKEFVVCKESQWYSIQHLPTVLREHLEIVEVDDV